MKFVPYRALLMLSALPFNSHGVPAPAEFHPKDSIEISLDADSPGFQPHEPSVPFTGTGPINASQLIEEVNRVFLQPLPQEERNLPQIMEDVNSEDVGRIRWVFYGVTLLVDITAPWTAVCRPVIRGVKSLATPIHCSGVPCSPIVSFRVQESYETTETFRIESTVSAGVNYKGFEASVSTTRERTWQKVWGSSVSQEVTYQWHLGANDHCTPSMAHVELDCDVDITPTYYDTFVHNRNSRLRLEHDDNRKGGGYFAGQWCTQFRIDQRPLRVESDWEWVLSSDRARGKYWKRPAREMRQWRLSGGTIQDDMIIVSRPNTAVNDWTEVMGCRRNRNQARRVEMTLPLSSENGVLEGFVGCVSSGRSASEGKIDELNAELKPKD